MLMGGSNLLLEGVIRWFVRGRGFLSFFLQFSCLFFSSFLLSPFPHPSFFPQVRVWEEEENGEFRPSSAKLLRPDDSTSHQEWVRDVAWAPNIGVPTDMIASCSQDGQVTIWTKGKGEGEWKFKHLEKYFFLLFLSSSFNLFIFSSLSLSLFPLHQGSTPLFGR